MLLILYNTLGNVKCYWCEVLVISGKVIGYKCCINARFRA